MGIKEIPTNFIYPDLIPWGGQTVRQQQLDKQYHSNIHEDMKTEQQGQAKESIGNDHNSTPCNQHSSSSCLLRSAAVEWYWVPKQDRIPGEHSRTRHIQRQGKKAKNLHKPIFNYISLWQIYFLLQ